ncbi:hypothetical protein [Vitiosangium sp. GDMCC 1.1324]|uniref:hypothetical protein n=1 Tax=Vitiosangium sp. (strain GDMCC 1.1324) TaxID=2138576 RepID=UPI000D37951C|nr:hypothetical protein [Vitiosangium sp. GDMCC 1.1324]PTL84673.1 hypothetical protein DAT35_06300 [Vitiosangium sp. GDMCC 1.1324]
MRIDRPGSPPVRPQALQTESKPTVAQKNAVRSPAAPARSADVFETSTRATAKALTPGRSSAAQNLPAEIPTGTKDYYRKRYDDFVRRNPGMTPPAYYLEYGQKYCDRFSSLGPKDLTPQGLEWRDRTLKALQESIETKRMEDPVGFAQLERDPEAFKKFAYDAHPDAYVNSGLYKLPAQDLMKIGTTPDLKDLFTKDGLRQVAVALSKMNPGDAVNVAKESFKELVHDLTPKFPSRIKLPHLSLPW